MLFPEAVRKEASLVVASYGKPVASKEFELFRYFTPGVYVSIQLTCACIHQLSSDSVRSPCEDGSG